LKALAQVHKHFIYFSLVGAIGFLVDTTVLYSLIHGFDSGLYVSRIASYLAAASTTWWLNSRYTFDSSTKENYVIQWVKFLWLNAFGGLINYGVYALLVASWSIATTQPVIAVAFGSIAGLVVNFNLSKRFVFRSS
jgi:putative flippase GtrA